MLDVTAKRKPNQLRAYMTQDIKERKSTKEEEERKERRKRKKALSSRR